MARKKVKVAWISNESARRATLKKRRKGLMKKVRELSTLCAVPACAIVFSSDDDVHDDPAVEMWPASPWEVRRVIGRFGEVPEMERRKRMMTQEGFLRQAASKAEEQLKRADGEMREHHISLLLYNYCLGLGLGLGLGANLSLKQLFINHRDHYDFNSALDHVINQLRHIIINKQQPQQQQHRDEEMSSTKLGAAMEALQTQSWFKSIINSHQINYNSNNNIVVGGGDVDDLEALMWGY